MSIRILIADDHPVFIDGMKAMLKEVTNFEVVGHAENGEKLIEQTAIHKPDVILTDIQMPVKDGIEATKEIHKRFPEIKIIAITMLNESMFIKKMLDAGASGYVIKTIDKSELINVIQKVAGGEKHFSAEVTAQLMNNYSERFIINPLDILTKREKEILTHIAEGLTDKEIAEKVFLSPLTVITHRKNILSKLGLKNKVELARFAIDNKLIS
ncbi:MAG TPA: response regulator transcription factor [Bacteroidia bacterium]|jgi:DNA-binding NarL/FixJ family response regulator|nr:response regulator transcription factor [Bacteroidia bacterium]